MSNGDTKITIQDLKKQIKSFRKTNTIAKFDEPKNLAMYITTEAAELMKLFLWKDKKSISMLLKSDTTFKEKIKDELADIFFASLNFSEKLDIDVSAILLSKIKRWEGSKTCPACAISCKNCENLRDVYELSRDISDSCPCIICQLLREAQEECSIPCKVCGGKPWEKQQKNAQPKKAHSSTKKSIKKA